MTNLEQILSDLWGLSAKVILGDGDFLEQLNQHVHFVQGGSRVMAHLGATHSSPEKSDYDYYFAIGKTDAWKSSYDSCRRNIAEEFAIRLRKVDGVTFGQDGEIHAKFYSQLKFNYEGMDVDITFGEKPEVYNNFQGLRYVASGEIALDRAHRAAYEAYQKTGEIKCNTPFSINNLHIAVRGYILKSFAKPLSEGARFSEDTAHVVMQLCDDKYEDRADLIAYMDSHYQGRMRGHKEAQSYLVELQLKAATDLKALKAQEKQKAIDANMADIINDQNREIAKLKSQVSALTESLAANAKAIETVKNERDAATEKVASLRAELDALPAEDTARLKGSITKLQQQNARVQAERDALQTEVGTLRASLEAALSQNEQYEAQAKTDEKAGKKIKEVENRLEEQKQETSAARNAEASARKEVARLQAQNNEQRTQIAALEKEVAAEKAKKQAPAPAPVKDEKALKKAEKAESERDEAKAALAAEKAKREKLASENAKLKTMALENMRSMQEMKEDADTIKGFYAKYKDLVSDRNAEVSRARMTLSAGMYYQFVQLLGKGVDLTPELMAAAIQFIQTLHQDDKENPTETLEFMGSEWGKNFKDNEFIFEEAYLEFDALVDKQCRLTIRDFQTRNEIIRQRVKAWMVLLTSEPFKHLKSFARERLKMFVSNAASQTAFSLPKENQDFLDKYVGDISDKMSKVSDSEKVEKLLPIMYFATPLERTVYDSLIWRLLKMHLPGISVDDVKRSLAESRAKHLPALYHLVLRKKTNDKELSDTDIFKITRNLLRTQQYYGNGRDLSLDVTNLLSCMTYVMRGDTHSNFHARLFDDVFKRIPETGLKVNPGKVLEDFASHPAFGLSLTEHRELIIELLEEAAHFYHNNLVARLEYDKAIKIYELYMQTVLLKAQGVNYFEAEAAYKINMQILSMDLVKGFEVVEVTNATNVLEMSKIKDRAWSRTRQEIDKCDGNLPENISAMCEVGRLVRGLNTSYVTDLIKILSTVSSNVWREEVGLAKNEVPDAKKLFSLLLRKSIHYAGSNGCEPFMAIRRFLTILNVPWAKAAFPNMTNEIIEELATYCDKFMMLANHIKREKLLDRLDSDYFGKEHVINPNEMITEGGGMIRKKHISNSFDAVIHNIYQFASQRDLFFDEEDILYILQYLRPDISNTVNDYSPSEIEKLKTLAEHMTPVGYQRYFAISLMPMFRDPAVKVTVRTVCDVLDKLRAKFPLLNEDVIIERFLDAISQEIIASTLKRGAEIAKSLFFFFLPRNQDGTFHPMQGGRNSSHQGTIKNLFTLLSRGGIVDFSKCKDENEKHNLANGVIDLISLWQTHKNMRPYFELLQEVPMKRKVLRLKPCS